MERRILGAVSAAAVACAVAAPAFAADPADYDQAAGQTDQMRVKVGDLNLASGGGALTAFNRVRTASQEFCSVSPGNRNLAVQAEARKCDAQMTYLAVKKLDAPMVTAMYEGSQMQPPVLLAAR